MILENFHLNNYDKSKPLLIVYSGGLDSTTILHQITRMFYEKKYPFDDYNFATIDCVHLEWEGLINKAKIDTESDCCQKFIDIRSDLIERTITLHHIHIESLDSIGYKQSDFKNGQALFFHSMVMPYMVTHNVIFGYNSEDSFWRIPYKMLLQDFIKQNSHTHIQEIFITPLECVKRVDIVKYILTYDLIPYVWTCEECKEVNITCGICAKCQSLKRDLLYLTEYDPDDNIRAKAKAWLEILKNKEGVLIS